MLASPLSTSTPFSTLPDFYYSFFKSEINLAPPDFVRQSLRRVEVELCSNKQITSQVARVLITSAKLFDIILANFEQNGVFLIFFWSWRDYSNFIMSFKVYYKSGWPSIICNLSSILCFFWIYLNSSSIASDLSISPISTLAAKIFASSGFLAISCKKCCIFSS